MPIQSVLLSYDGRINRSDFWIKGVLPIIALSILAAIAVVVLSVVHAALGIVAYVLFIPLSMDLLCSCCQALS